MKEKPMTSSHSADSKVAEILDQMRHLLPCRRGSLTEQKVVTTGPDGRLRTRGPYPIYTFKEKGRTISRRVTDPAQVALYREQIERGRRFQVLSAQLLRLAEAQADAHADQAAPKKTPKSKSRRNAKLPFSSNG
jgi:hypothetical protein